MTDHDPAIIRLRDLIAERTGLFFADLRGLETVEVRSRAFANEYGSVSEYTNALAAADTSGTDWSRLITALSKPYSSFFRHEPKVKALTEIVIPEWLTSHTNETLNIWSAACGRGEEPLYIAMALGKGGWFDRLDVRIDATDLNEAAIREAEQGRYPDTKLTYFPTADRERYFERSGDEWFASRELLDSIRFSTANLLNENEIATLAANADVVVCCNVFIYFADGSIERVLRLLAKLMRPGAYLFSDGGDHFGSIVARVEEFTPVDTDICPLWMRR